MRTGVRAILLDPEDRLLLLRGRDPTRPERPAFWFTVGGGLEPGESPERGLRREIEEEVGIREVQLGPAVWLLRHRFAFAGQDIDQENTFYLARTAETALDGRGRDPVEREAIVDTRWWALAELHATRDQLYPQQLVERLTTLFAAGPPSAPVRLPDE